MWQKKSKQSNKSLKGFLVLFVLLGLVGINIVSDTFALTYQENVPVEFTFEPSISINLSYPDLIIEDLAPGSASDSNTITVTTSTNNITGYTLSADAGNGTTYTDTKLINDEAYFTSLATDASISGLNNINAGYWGYAFSTDGSAWSNYSGLPYYNTTPKELASTNTNGSSSVQFKIAASADNWQASGEYKNVVNFYAVTNPEPAPGLCTDTATCMQTMTECPTSPTDVTDARDGTTYKVQKLNDGNCWMLDNLALDLYDSNVLNNLSSTNTDIDSNNEAAILKSLKQGNRTAGNQYATAGLTSWPSESNSYSVPEANLASKDVIPSDATSQAGQYKVGGYYNYCAATAGSYCYGSGTSTGTSSGNATSSICPAGWKLPTGNTNGQFDKLYTTSSYDYNTYAKYRAALHLPLSGYFSNGQAYGQDSYGFWWSSTHGNNSYMYGLDSGTYSVITTYNVYRLNGYSVRCVRSS